MKKSIICTGLFFLYNTTNAQFRASIDSVVIKENRIETTLHEQNKNIQVLTRKQIAALPVKSTAELLSYVNGVDLRQRGPSGVQADISIDGSTFDEVLVLVNGVKMSDPQTGHHVLNLPIPLAAIDHIEILRGSSASIYGVNALAGAVNIITRQPVKNEVTAQLYTASSFEKDTSSGERYYGSGAQASAAFANEKQSHLIAASHDQGNGYRYNTAFNAYRVFYNSHVQLNDKNAIEAMGGYTSNTFGAALYYAAPYDNEAKETVQTATGSIKYIVQPSQRLKITPRISYRYNKDDYIYIRQQPEVYHNIHETNVVTGEIQSVYTMTHSAIGAGVEYRSEHIGSTNLGKRGRNNLGVYAEYKYYFNSRLNARVGVYGNYNSDYDLQLFPGIDIGYAVNKNWKLFANASTGQRLPTYTDLYYNGPSNIGNDQLKPEYASYANGGIRFTNRSIFAEASYFYRHTTDFIDWVKDSLAGKWQPQNFQSVNTQGLSLRLNYDLNEQFGLSDDIKIALNLGYTYLDAAIETPSEKISKYAIDALRHQFIASLRTTFFNKIQLNVNSRYQYRISANDYTLLDARLALLFTHWNIYVDASNILDTDYKEIGAVPLPGRWYTLGLRLQL